MRVGERSAEKRLLCWSTKSVNIIKKVSMPWSIKLILANNWTNEGKGIFHAAWVV